MDYIGGVGEFQVGILKLGDQPSLYKLEAWPVLVDQVREL